MASFTSRCSFFIMTQVLQQRCSPVGMAQQSYTAPPFRSDSMLANQSKDHSASGVSGLLAASNMETVSSTDSPLPTYDLAPMLALKNGDQSETIQQLCQAVANCLHDTGCLVIRDPRVKIEDNMAFLDMMERYFAQSTAAKMRDTRPDLHFQVGATPEGIETPKCTVDPTTIAAIASQPAEDRARTPQGADPKWRYMWRIGERPADTCYSELNAEPVIPADFPEWPDVMSTWGNKMLAAVHTVSQMAAVGFGLPADAFTERMAYGPHLLAPTGADLEAHHTLNMCYAGYHYDLNFLTIHGKSRFPGLFVWLRNGKRVAVRIPAGCLFIQAGKQMEWLTGGYVKAGMHEEFYASLKAFPLTDFAAHQILKQDERMGHPMPDTVICSEETLTALKTAQVQGLSTWRVSSTVFGHIASDQVLRPLSHFAMPQAAGQLYPAIDAGKFVQQELEAINLKQL